MCQLKCDKPWTVPEYLLFQTMFQQLFAITRNTFVEAIRQPIFMVLIGIGILLLTVINPSMAAYSMDHGADIQMMITMGLSMVALITLLLAAFTTTGVVAEEIERKTVLTVVSKPVGKPLFIVSKFLGVACAIALAYYLLSLTLLLTYRHGVMTTARDHFDQPVMTFGVLAVLVALVVATVGNYLYRWVFTSTFIVTACASATVALSLVSVISHEWTLQSPLTDLEVEDWRGGQLIIGQLVIFQAMLILTAIAIACSTRLGRLPTILICWALFLFGLVSNSLSGAVNKFLSIPQSAGVYESMGAIWASDAELHVKLLCLLLKVIYLVFPNLQFLWPGEAIFQGHPFTLELLGMMSVYALMHITVALCIAVILFQRREVG